MLIQQTFKGRLILQSFKLFPYRAGENTNGLGVGFQTLKGDYLEQELKKPFSHVVNLTLISLMFSDSCAKFCS